MRKMTIALTLTAFFALLAAPGFAGTAAPAPAEAPVSAELSLDQLLADPVASAVAGGECAEAAADAQPAAQGFCPYGAPTCNQDRDCDAWCGAPGFGECEFHHWTGCCICLG